jgi:hypothetical protein
MASIYKTIRSEDIASTRTVLHEAIPLTGTIVSGTYSDSNIKNYSHGMFQSVYDYPYLSSSANHIFDISMGIGEESALYNAANSAQVAKKRNIYNQMAQVLMGYDKNGNINRFDADGDLFTTTGDKMDDVVFLTFSRLLVKDEIQKGTFTLELGVSGTYATPFGGNRITLKDTGAASDYRVNSPVGEYGILYLDETLGNPLNPAVSANPEEYPAGLIYYQAGVAVLTSSVFNDFLTSPVEWDSAGQNITSSFTGSVISSSADSLRHRIYNISFNNSIELNSTIYFCHLGANEFNYSANPTYLSGSQIKVKNQSTDDPVSYMTTIGLYSSDNQLMATAKLSEPIKKTPATSLTFRVRLDY